MNTYITKNPVITSQPIYCGRSNQNPIPTIADNRSESFQANILQELAGHTPQTLRSAQLQAMADEYAISQPVTLDKHFLHKPRHVVQALQRRAKPAHQLKEAATNFSTRSTSFHPSSYAPVIQRSVYVGLKGQEVKKMPKHQEDPGYDQALNELIEDNVHRHFLNEAELERFKNRQFGDTSIDYIGTLFSAHLGSDKPWIRIDPNKLTILGEDHSHTTLLDVARALQTKRFMYESIEKIPFKMVNRRSGVTESLKDRNKQKLSSVVSPLPREINPPDHHLETFYRRYAYGLSLVYENITKDHSLLSGDAPAGLNCFFEMLRMTKVIAGLPTPFLSGSEREIKQEWHKNATEWNPLMTRLEEGENIGDALEAVRTSTDILQPMIEALINYNIDNFGTYGQRTSVFSRREHIDDALKKPNLKNLFQSNDNHGIFRHRIDSWRENYMWERIRHAEKKRDKYILVGMGDAHRRNLINKITGLNVAREQRNIDRGLEDQGQSIVHYGLDEFIRSAETTAKEREDRAGIA